MIYVLTKLQNAFCTQLSGTFKMRKQNIKIASIFLMFVVTYLLYEIFQTDGKMEFYILSKHTIKKVDVNHSKSGCKCYMSDRKNVIHDFCFHAEKTQGKKFNCEWLPYLEKLNIVDASHQIFEDFNYTLLNNRQTIVTAASSNHFLELMGLIENVKETFSKPDIIIYNIGLDYTEIQIIEGINNVTLIPFNFNQFPSYVSLLKEYRWKSIIIAEALQLKNHFWYVDPSIVWHHAKFFDVYSQLSCNSKGACSQQMAPYQLHDNTGTSIKMVTNPRIYEYLPMSGNKSATVTVFGGGFVFVVKSKLTLDILKWYVLCSLEKDCMAPAGSQLSCNWGESDNNVWAGCHRYDQSAINIILNNLISPSANYTTDNNHFATVSRGRFSKNSEQLIIIYLFILIVLIFTMTAKQLYHNNVSFSIST